jgi:hypothetical protein
MSAADKQKDRKIRELTDEVDDLKAEKKKVLIL